jgi:molybdate transport system substrate-binding protein
MNATVMRFRYSGWVFCAALLLHACGARQEPEPAAKLTVAAAANLTDVFAAEGQAFQAKTGIDVVFSYGATAQLAQQIDNGAPFDLFASADTEHIDSLISIKKLTADSRAVYAVGQLVLWIPKGEASGIRELKDITGPKVRFLAVAQPDLAPYGQAAVDALKSAGLWAAAEPKVVYANSISQSRQLAATGNADAAFTAYSLVLKDQGTVLKIDPSLYHPIQQALGIVAASPNIGEAKQFRDFLLGPDGRKILEQGGYLLP